MTISDLTIPWQANVNHQELFGINDEYIRILQEAFDVSVFLREGSLHITGEEGNAADAKKVLLSLILHINRGQALEKQTVEYTISRVKSGEEVTDDYGQLVTQTVRGKRIRAKTYAQRAYIDAIRENDITFVIGPAGTGKTYLAIAMAVNAYKNGEVNRIVLVRPAVEAGERLGFLPGDLKEKVDPYLRPIYDALYDIMGIDGYERNAARGVLEVAPLAYMRGRTLDNAFIILDEAQNTTPEQMKMFLTRLGFGSKAVVTGDVTQIDLPQDKESGLTVVSSILTDIKGIAFIYLTQKDVVRNSIVQKIINAYEKFEEKK